MKGERIVIKLRWDFVKSLCLFVVESLIYMISKSGLIFVQDFFFLISRCSAFHSFYSLLTKAINERKIVAL